MPTASPHPPLEIPDATVDRYVLEHAESYGERPALVSGETGAVLTYAALARQVDQAAAGFAARGIAPRDVVAIYAPNVPEYAIAYLGALRAGACATTVNGLYTADELAFQLRDSGARLLVTVAALLDRALEAAAAVGIADVVSLDGGAGASGLADLLVDADPPAVALDPARELAALPYSSGTTGFPKGVMLTHRNLVANAHQFLAVRPYGEDGCTVGILPFFHSYGQTVILNAALRSGAKVVTMARFDLETYLRLTQEHRATVAYVAPPVVLALAKHPLVDGFDMSSLRELLSGAAPLDAALAAACRARIGVRAVQGYGMTEASPVTHAVPSAAEDRPGSVGPLLPGMEQRIVDLASGEEVAPGERGELWVRGPNVMPGYLGNEAATRATLTDDGWLRTGDVAVGDEDGWTWIVDRVKELIKVSGFQVAPAELEALLIEHPGVADACVIGVPDDEKGEVPKGFVVLRDDATSADEIAAFVAARVAPHKRLRAIEVLDAIPKSPSGKILRRVLADREKMQG